MTETVVSSLPTGAIVSYGGTTAPPGYLLCDGSVVSQTTYARLFAILSTTYNTSGEGAGNFRLPDLRGRMAVGADGSAGRMATSDALGNAAGVENVTVSTPELPVHTHAFPQSVGSTVGTGYSDSGNASANGISGTGFQGGGGSHNNMQPFQITQWMVAT